MDEWVSDPIVYFKNVLNYFTKDKVKRVVVVFDNADKRDRDQQLKIFQEVQIFRSQFRVFSILALRDETYDRHENEPPLDTYLAAFTFRITPPRFLDVVKRRLELIIGDMALKVDKCLEFSLGNGAMLRYPSSDLGKFLVSFYKALFNPKRKIRLALETLAGRNVRKALQMFLDILMSGHMTADSFFSARVLNEEVFLPEKLILRILTRTKYRYFSDGHGYIFNIYSQNDEHYAGAPFSLLIILSQLAECRKTRGELGIEGYRLVSNFISELGSQGIGQEEALSELRYLLNHELIQADHQRTDDIRSGDYVQITASGYYHLKFFSNRAEYNIGVAGDIWYRDEDRARKVYELVALNLRKDYINKDKIKIIQLLMDEFNHELSAFKKSALIDSSTYVEESLTAISNSRTRLTLPSV